MQRLRDFRYALTLCTAVVVGALPAQGAADQPVTKIEQRIDAGLEEAGNALDGEAARMDELADWYSDQTLPDGKPSVGQAAANIRIWDRRIRELGAQERNLREGLEGALAKLRPVMDELAERLSPNAQHVEADERTVEEEAESLPAKSDMAVHVDFLPARGAAGKSVAEIERRVDAALEEAGNALDGEAARMDELADWYSDQTLPDGKPSAGQAAANIRIWDRRIRELGAQERNLREGLESALAKLRPVMDELAERLSPNAQHVEADERTVEEEAESLPAKSDMAVHVDFLPARGAAGKSVAEIERRVDAALEEAGNALDGEAARMDELADWYSDRTLPDGKPSAGQAAANARLWDKRIRELEAQEGKHREVLESALAKLRPVMDELAERLSPTEPPVVEPRLERSERALIQRSLSRLGFDPGPADGVFGKKTREAIRSWQASAGDEATGLLTGEQAKQLIAGGGTVSEPREEPVLDLGKSERILVQRGLSRLEFDPGLADGVFGRKTREAIRSWQSAAGDEVTGFLTRGQADALIAEGRKETDEGKPSFARREEAALGLEKSERVLVQRGLSRLGLDPGPEDGIFNRQTRLALARWQLLAGDEATGFLTREHADSLIDAGESGPQPSDPSVPGNRVFRDCPECPEMAVVPQGSFTMGSPAHEKGRTDAEGPAHSANIERRFAVGVYEITRSEFGHFVSATGHRTRKPCWSRNDRKSTEIDWKNPGFHQTDRDPVVCVDWSDARAYADWLSQKTGKTYRLLDEWKWEYAARAGTTTARYWGKSVSQQCRYANGAGLETSSRRERNTVCRDGYEYTAPAGSFRANRWGLHDMLGNVWEWTSDCWTENYSELNGDCSMHVLRGGAWDNPPSALRSARRTPGPGDFRAVFVGFRVARTLAH